MENEQTQKTQVPPKTSGLAIAGLILGIFGFCTAGISGIVGLVLGILGISAIWILGIFGFCTAGISGIVGLVLGIAGLIAIRKRAGQLKGKGLSIAGIIVSAASLFMLLITNGITVLAMTFSPAFAEAKDQARNLMLQNHAKQLGMAMQMYCIDFGEQLPPTDNWPQALEPYSKSTDILTSPFNPDAGRAWAMNINLAGKNLSQLREPGRTVLFFECRPGSPPAGGPTLLPDEPHGQDGYIIGFVDSHIESIPPEQINALIWSP